ncbi:MAG: beta-glucosidase [Paludibacteraceae bacterium]|nr:beta-glucosidase [Paludibacteraceae bacterium]MBO4454431.1 beta-glucosidase [Paludibacteraceae bacterium]
MKHRTLLCFILLALIACQPKNTPAPSAQKVTISSVTVTTGLDSIIVAFGQNARLDIKQFDNSGLSISPSADFAYDASVQGSNLILALKQKLKYFSAYTFHFDNGNNLGVRVVDDFTYKFTTPYDPSPKFPVISDDELLTLVQARTFRYFYDFAHPVSGLARERNSSGDVVTSGGSGFGLAAFPVAVERGFISRADALAHCSKVVDFLANKAERFHGAYPHWLDGNTGKAIAFSTKDNGADLVETAFLIEGLLVLRQYFSGASVEETALRDKITAIWEGVEWTWFQRNGQNMLYWHWSPNYEWAMNMPIRGWNEALIVYVLAASSPTHGIDKAVYTEGWTRNGAIRNGKKYYDILLPLGDDKGGPMFFAHYSFLGLNPMNLSDEYAHYGEQNTAHARINYAYSLSHREQPNDPTQVHWGLTASDIPGGYSATSPTNDNGTTAPTAALASIPYTPDESMAALRYFYYTLGDKLWGEYGFYDAFNLPSRWFAKSYIAIDQGPIIVMIENYRTGLIWRLFMSCPEIQEGLKVLDITYTPEN